ncbi:C3 and PZP-like alpha-2-macroglobulin domain-containing protein 8 isoform X2 [Galleria mellonella]|uniref:C3 and PZP-like alpha-2-macroglobulin domain-containing protein 8 isoform X2 n=1 Tax=Galleria mellonella TaxID=7137 RepID=A0A6J1WU38_GALME|nr:C3 and PZP-like alpha-2-macroglobulin domain-containing protein 8 isoform X2 [Galleria mellonella]
MTNFLDVATEDNLQYQFFPVSSGSVTFKVRTPNDAHLALTLGPQESDPMYEVFIGGWGNTKSVIRRNRTKPDKVEVDTPGILNGGEFRGFWVRWDGGVVSAGREGEVIPFISWTDPEPFPVGFVGVCTGWGATGTWKIEAQPSAPQAAALYSTPPGYPGGPAPGGAGVWAEASGGQVPPEAVLGGQDSNGEPLYVARAQHEGAILPGKLVASHGCAYVPWGGQEHGKPTYQVLVGGPNNWVPTNGSNVPPGAFPGGQTEDGETLFIGRVRHEGSVTTGKVQQSHGVCYISFGGQELGFPDYEILMA